MMSRQIFPAITACFLSIASLSGPLASQVGASGRDDLPAGQAQRGRGNLLVIGVESVSQDTLDLMIVRLDGTMQGSGTRSTGRGWNRFENLPSGEHELKVFHLGFEPRRVPVRILAGREDTVTVVLTPDSAVKPGHTYVTHPPAPLPVRPSDDEKYPLRGFSFSFLTEHGERVDTAAGLVTKDLIGDPDATISILFSPAELDRIRNRMLEMRFFDVAYTPPNPWPSQFDSPHIEATAGGVTRRLDWRDEADGNLYPSDERKRIRDLVELIREVVSARPEYRALPEPRGAYL